MSDTDPSRVVMTPTAACTPVAQPTSQAADPEPVRPLEPDPSECCGSGCVRCVFDVYDESLARYEMGVALTEFCERKLEEAELRVRKWLPDNSTAPLDDWEDEA